MGAKAQWQFYIDRGGTFTDVIGVDANGKTYSEKLLSENPEHYHDSVLAGIRKILNLGDEDLLPVADIATVKMGTTVATNALLERRGEPLVLVTNQGFKDVLHIGYQNRPHLFALKIELPGKLYEEVIEVSGRINFQGEKLIPLDINDARKKLQAAFNKGYRAIAVCLMHSYAYPDHELRLKKLAKVIGFKQISVSHEVTPVMRIVGRGDTTVVDAYLSPILKRYIDHVQQDLKSTKLYFMQSNGGLALAQQFQGKDSILSGPAGGVVGMVKSSVAAGFNKVIGFDMGGTSTDISHYAGQYERTFESEVAGCRLRSPMMLINTIAAGGGSILHFDQGRFVVGPDSAGAVPGPACYRRDGPLTITDTNVLLGKIQADFFPKCFGADGQQSLDTEIVKQKFTALTKAINNSVKQQRSIEQVAEGFLTIAIENMANAIKKLSIQRGYNVHDYVLNCFGAASGQHACLVADALRINKILIHPLAGVLSAYGIANADLSVVHEQAVEQQLIKRQQKIILQTKDELISKAIAELKQQGAVESEIKTKVYAHLKYQGTDTTLLTDFDIDFDNMMQQFTAIHQQRFGFYFEKRKIITESLSVTAYVEQTFDYQHYPAKHNASEVIPLRQTKVFSQGKWHEAKIYQRDQLPVGFKLNGVAIIIEANATTVIEPDWQAEITKNGDLLLTRITPRRSLTAIGTDVDPVMLELFNNRFMAIAEEMGVVLRNTATSVNIKERLDFSCAVFNPDGELVANAPHIPVHLGSMSESVKHIKQQRGDEIKPGDVYALNAPYAGGTHLPDITVITPVFNQAKTDLIFFVASRGHHADIGGITPGSMPPNSQNVNEEGILIDNFQVCKDYQFLEKAISKLLTKHKYPARNPAQNIADLKAQIAANETGIHGLQNLVAEFGLAVVHAYMHHVRDNASASVKQMLRRMHSGKFINVMDDGSKIQVKVTVTEDKQHASIDFTGTSAQVKSNFNAPIAVTKAAVLYVMRCLVQAEIPLNGGCLEPINLIIPEGSLLNPQYPAAVVAGNVETSQMIVDALFAAFKIMASAQGTCNNFTFGNERYQYYETICGGAGAGFNFDGASAVHTHMTNTRLTDPEVLELRFPVLLREFSIRHGSGGQGKYHGGDGAVRKIEFLEAMQATIVSSHRTIAPFGYAGGDSAAKGKNYVIRANGEKVQLKGSDQVVLECGDLIVIETPGGGGYGTRD